MKEKKYFGLAVMIILLGATATTAFFTNQQNYPIELTNKKEESAPSDIEFVNIEKDMSFLPILQSENKLVNTVFMGTDIQITSDAANEQHPSIAIDANGNPFVLYDREIGLFQHEIIFQISSDKGNNWPATQIFQLIGNEDLSAIFPDVKMMDDGTRALATFQNERADPIVYLIDMADINAPESWTIWNFDVSGSSEYVEGTAIATYGEKTFAIAHTRDYTSGTYDLDSTIMIYWNTDIDTVEADGVQGVFWTTEDVFYAHPDATSGNNKLFVVTEQDTGEEIKLFVASAPVDLVDYTDWSGWTIRLRGGDLTYPKIAVSGNNHYIVAMSDVDDNKDIVCYTSKFGGSMWNRYSVAANPIVDEMYPSIVADGETAIVSFIQNGDLYFSKSEDAGKTWTEPQKINDGDDTLIETQNCIDMIGPYISWSDNRNTNSDLYFDSVPAAVLSIDEISGGFGVNAVISNTGTADSSEITWSISLDGGLVIMGNKTTGTITSLSPNSSQTISSDFVLGFGSVVITVIAKDKQLTAEGFVLGPLVVGL